MLLAAPDLKAMRKSGWNLLYYGALVGAAAAVFELFADGAGLFSFLDAALGTVIGAYILFQVRERFIIMSHPPRHKTASKAAPAHGKAGAEDE